MRNWIYRSIERIFLIVHRRLVALLGVRSNAALQLCFGYIHSRSFSLSFGFSAREHMAGRLSYNITRGETYSLFLACQSFGWEAAYYSVQVKLRNSTQPAL